jgi:hypothetical protein
MSKVNRVGEKFTNKLGHEIEVVEYFNYKNCTVRFKDGFLVKNVEYGQVKKGHVNNPLFPSFLNIGYIGIGIYVVSINGKHTKSYTVWSGILQRCYSVNTQLKQSTYIGCSVDERWHNFQKG